MKGMRVCPKCGYKDDPNWRQSNFKWNADFTEFSNFQQMYPEMAKQILQTKWQEDDYFLYKLTKGMKVIRMAKFEYTKEMYNLHGLTESAKKKRLSRYHIGNIAKQTKLLEVTSNSV